VAGQIEAVVRRGDRRLLTSAAEPVAQLADAGELRGAGRCCCFYPWRRACSLTQQQQLHHPPVPSYKACPTQQAVVAMSEDAAMENRSRLRRLHLKRGQAGPRCGGVD